MNQDLAGAIGTATAKSTPAIGAVAAVEVGIVPPSLQTIVLVLTGIGVVIQFSYTLWKWHHDRQDRRNRA